MKKYQLFASLGLILLVISYFTPIWWVALQSIQYPKSMYPNGIRIEFKYNGVYNGCEGQQERAELASSQAGADCLVEMNAINHFIGMFHITQGRNTEGYREYPIYYVFDTQKDEQGNEVIDPETGKAVKIDVTPGFLKGLDFLMVYSPYFFAFFFLFGLLFIFSPKKLNLAYALVPAFLPLYFLAGYITGLYWYGHHLGLHGGGAFGGINEFMPTVFGEGKVAQFVTMSYPYIGFFLTLGTFIFFVLAILTKRKELKNISA